MKNFNQSNPIKKERNMKRINTIATFCSLLFVISCGFQFIINAAYGIQTALGIDKFLNNFLTYYWNKKTYMYDGIFLIIGYVKGKSDFTTNTIFYLTSTIIYLIVALIFTNLFLLFRTAAGKTKKSIGETPFQPEIINILKRINVLIFAIPVVEIILMLLCRLVSTANIARVTIRFDGLVVAFIILALSHFFTYGMEIQNDVDGLV